MPDAFIYRLSGGGQLQITNVVTALDIASKDKRIKGIIAHIAASPFRYADVQEIRDAVIRFRKSGKPAFALQNPLVKQAQATVTITWLRLSIQFSCSHPDLWD